MILPTSTRSTALVASLAMLGACVPSLRQSETLREPESYAAERSVAGAERAWPAEGWWRAYNDPQLSALVEEGLATSPNLAAAAARVRRAAALAQVAGGEALPLVGAEASADRVRQSLNTGFPDAFKDFLPQGWNSQGRVALTLSQQLDFFGRARANTAAARADAEVAAYEGAAARLQLSTAIALAYADLARFGADLAAADEIVALRQHSAELVLQRQQAGLEDQGASDQARSELYAARADAVAAGAAIARTRHQLAALLGQGPDRGLDISAPQALPAQAAGVPANLAADLIGRRPDIAAARARAQAAAERVNAARAAFYPNVNLNAVIGVQALGLDLLSDGDSRFGSVGPAISLPLFSSGRLAGAYRGGVAGYDETIALYNQTLANALREVADALTNSRAVAAELAAQREALIAAQDAYRVAQLRYQGGLSNYVDTLTVENGLVARRRAAADLEARAFAADIELIRALGGGFDLARAQDSNPQEKP